MRKVTLFILVLAAALLALPCRRGPPQWQVDPDRSPHRDLKLIDPALCGRAGCDFRYQTGSSPDSGLRSRRTGLRAAARRTGTTSPNGSWGQTPFLDLNGYRHR